MLYVLKQVAKGVMWQRGETCKTMETCNGRNVLVVDMEKSHADQRASQKRLNIVDRSM